MLFQNGKNIPQQHSQKRAIPDFVLFDLAHIGCCPAEATPLLLWMIPKYILSFIHTLVLIMELLLKVEAYRPVVQKSNKND